MQSCIICSNERLVKCYGIECCKECKIIISHRPPNYELFSYIDSVYRYKEGFAYDVHKKLYRFWYDREGQASRQISSTDRYRSGASLLDLCADVIVRDASLVLACNNTFYECAPIWYILLKAWCRWKHKRGRKSRNPHKQLLGYYGYF